jgi:hypothetical protein
MIQAETSNLRPSFSQLAAKPKIICHYTDKNDRI